MKNGDVFYAVCINDTELCYGDYPSLAIYPNIGFATKVRVDLHLRFPSQDYTIKKLKIEIVD